MALRRGAPSSPVAVAFALILAVAGCSGSESNPSAASPGAEVEPSPETSTAASIESSPEPPPGQFTVDGMTVRLVCKRLRGAHGGAAAGWPGPVEDWDEVIEGLGPETRTCGFEYPGAGDAPPIDEPMTPKIVSDTLAGALEAAGEEPPYLMVGHSLAGLSLRVLVGVHPDLTAGVVLFDGTPVESSRTTRSGWRRPWTGMRRPPSSRLRRSRRGPTCPWRCWRATRRSRTALGPFKVLWHQGQLALTALAPQGHHRVVAGAGHFIFQDSSTSRST